MITIKQQQESKLMLTRQYSEQKQKQMQGLKQIRINVKDELQVQLGIYKLNKIDVLVANVEFIYIESLRMCWESSFIKLIVKLSISNRHLIVDGLNLFILQLLIICISVNIFIINFKIVNLLFSYYYQINHYLLTFFMENISHNDSPENISHIYQLRNVSQQPETAKEQLQYLSSPPFIFGNSSLLQKILVTWVTPIAQLGYSRPLDFKDIPKMREDQRINDKLEKFEEIFKQQSKKSGNKPGRTLLKTVLKYQWKQQCVFLFLTLLVLACKIAILLFNQQLIKYIEAKRTAHDNLKYFVIYAVLLFMEMILTDSIFYFYTLRDRDLTYILSLMVYKKVLRYPLISSKEFQLAQIVNYSQSDADKFKWLHWEITIVIYSTLYTVICLGLVYYFVGVISLVCVLLLIAVCYISFILFDVVEEVESMFYKGKDYTIKVVQQILQSINFIKFNVLQKYFLDKVSEKRREQLNALSQLYSIKTFINLIFSLVSPIMVFALFFLFLKFHNQHISTPLAFFILTIFNNIQVLAQDFPQWFSHLIATWVSVKRIENFLLASEISQTLSINYQCENQKNAIEIRNGNFFWQQINQQKNQGQSTEQNEYNRSVQSQSPEDDNSSEYSRNQHRVLRKIFHNLNIDFKLNKLTMIYGKVGSGKTSLFHSILNEMTCEQGSKSKVAVNGEISYSSQKPWLFEGTIKQNIVFFDVEDKNRLNQAIYYSNLQSDLGNFKQGINTQISENGSNLSGGQRARISLARALYSNKNIYLFDDLLSALDVHVSQFIVENTLKHYLRDQTIVMSTNDMKILNYADIVYEINDGDLRLLAESEYKNKQYKVRERSQLNDSIPIKNVQHRASIQQKFKQIQMQDSNLIIPENQQTGDISIDIYKHFIDLNGNKIRLFAILFLFGCWSYLSYLANIQIEDWCEDKNRAKVFLYLYLGLFFVSGLLISLASILIQFCQIYKNQTIHRNIMNSILHASVSQFFNRVPSGRILNRMTNDLVGFDFTDFHQCKPLLINIFSIISCFIACIYVSKPIVLIPMIILVLALVLYFKFSIKSQQQCLRLQKISNSHIVTGLIETINGIGVIRALKKTSQILRNQIQKVEVTRSIALTMSSLSHWLLIRDSFIVYISMLALVFYCIFGEKSGAQLGIVLMYGINFKEQIGFIFPSILSFRERMIQFQRVVDLSKIPPEPGHTQQSTQNNQLQQEQQPYILQFINYSAKYRKEAPLSLNNINLKIRAGTKLGIVGRTGAGKSSLFNSIYRLLQPTYGLLKINGKQIRQYQIEDLRSQLTIIEQNPTIINGSLRENLDPNNCYGDPEIKNALLSCKLNKFSQKTNGLDQMISNRTMSIGEKQLISICRAVLKKSKLILMDEATASIDSQLNTTIERIVYELFKQSTVLLIAHKLPILQKCDEILVLQDGMVVQYGKKKDLLETSQSMYHKMHVSNDTLYLV